MRIYFVLFLLIVGTLKGQQIAESTCKAGVSTDSNGFQGTNSFIKFVSFGSISNMVVKSPFTDYHTSLQDLFISMWVKVDNTSSIKTSANIFKCTSSSRADSSIQISLNIDNTLKVAFLSTTLTTSSLKDIIDMSGWNHFGLYIDQQKTLRLSINQKIIGSQALAGDGNLFVQLMQYSESCQFGGGSQFIGSLRHFLISSGSKTTINDYNVKYANSVPAPLDPNLIAYFSFENEDEIKATATSVTGNITFSKSNMPDPVCKCTESPDDESSNYPLLSPSTSYLQDIRQIRYPVSSDSYILKATITMNIRRFQAKNTSQSEIITHRGLWSFGIFNRSAFYANITGVPNIIIFQVSPQRMRNQTLFMNYWMNYTLLITKSQALLIISDLITQTPLTISVTFDTPIKVDELFTSAEASGNFALRPQGIDCVVSRLIYSISDSQIFDFKLSLDNFIISAKGADVTYKNYYSKTYIGYFQSLDKQLLANYPGIQYDQVLGPCNISDPQFAFDGVVCKDKKKFLYLNKEMKSNQRLEGYLRSSNNMFTFETWFKFMGFANDQQASAIILQVYGLMDALQLQISILPGSMSSLFSIQCDPNSKVPRVPNFQDPVTVSNLIQIGTWMHYSCVSNYTTKELKAQLFNSFSSTTFSSVQQNSYMISVPEGIPARTVIGNSLTATNPYIGYLREMRFWKIARTQYEIETYRFQSIPVTSELRNQLLVYAMLNEGLGISTIELEQVSYMNAQNLYLASGSNSVDNYPQTFSSPISWQQDLSAIRVCPPDTVYNDQTNCCAKAAFYLKTFKSSFIANDDGKNYLSLSVQIFENFTDSHPIQESLYIHSWSIVNISNYSSTSLSYNQHINQIQSYLQNSPQTYERDILIPQDILSSTAFYMFKVSVKSLVKNFDAIQEQYMAVKPDCPQIRISPKMNDQSPLYVSSKMDPNLLVLKAEIKDNCADPQITGQGITWTVSNSLASYMISDDKRTLTFKQFQGIEQLQVTVVYKFSRSNNQQVSETIADSQLIYFVDEPFELKLNEIPKKLDVSNQQLIFDSSLSQIIVNYPIQNTDKQIEYLVDCPFYLFYQEKDRLAACRPNQTNGFLKLSLINTAFVNYQEYKFTYIMKSSILGYEQRMDIAVSFYQQTSNLCPKISLLSYTSYSITDDNFIIKPNIQLDCIRNAQLPNQTLESYTLINVQWLVEGSNSPNEFLDIYNNTAVVRRTSQNAALFQPYFRKNITIQGTLNNGTVLQAKTTFQISKADIVVNITSSQTSSNVVAFNNSLTLDASNSYDPDAPSQALNVNWTMNGGAFKKLNKQSITLSPFDRLDNQFNLGQLVPIQIDLMNNNYPDRIARKTLIYKFEQQNDNRVPIFGSNCQIVLSNANTNYIFDRNNITAVQVSASIDSTKCFGTKYLNAQGKFYTDLPDILRKSDQPNYNQIDTIKLQNETISLIEPGKTMIIHFIYLVSYQLQYQNDVFYDYIVKTISITRLQSPIVIQISGVPNLANPINVGQESSIILDASSSYDPDYPNSQSSFTYEWKCSQGLSCDSTGPQLTISKSMREQRGVNDIGTVIEIGVKVYSFKKQSQVQTLQVTIIPQNFDKCLQLGLENSQSNILTIYKDQEYPLQVKLSPQYVCANMSITNVTWTTQDVPQFWATAGNSQIYFTIPSPTLIYEGVPLITVTAIVKYTVFATSLTTSLQKSYSFKLKIEGSQIVPIVQTNNPYSSIIDLGTNFNFQLSAQKSYDPDTTIQKVVCAWTCPPQIVNAARCPYQGCDLSFNVSTDIKMLNESATSELMEFIVVVQTIDGLKTAQRSVFFTLLSPSKTEQMPLCYIQNANGKTTFDVDSEMVFYPKCMPRTLNSTFNGEFKFEWMLSPKVNGVLLNQYRLNIAPFQLFSGLTNKTAGSFEISLRVYTQNSEYIVKKVFKIPAFYDRHPNATLAKFEVSPAIIQTQFTNVRALVSNYDLESNAYFRLRVQLRDGTQQIIVQRYTGVLVDVYVPKSTEQIFLDIIENKRVNQGDYNIFTFRPEGTFQIEDVTSMSKQLFTFKVSQRLEKQEDPNFDYNDASLVSQSLDNLKILKKIISIASKDGQARYNSLMYPQVELLLNKTISLNRVTNFESSSTTFKRFRSGFFEILGPMYLENCAGDYSQEALEYLQRLDNEILSASSLQLIQDKSTESQIKQTFVKNLNSFAKATCLNETQRSQYRRMSDQIFITMVLEGEFYQYISPLDSLEMYTMYKISDFDIVSKNLIQYAAPDNQFTVKVISDILPMETRYITYRMIDSVEQDSNFTIQDGKEYIVSYSLSQINMFDQSFSMIPINASNYHNFKVSIDFNLQKSITPSILSKKDRLATYLYCISKQEEELNFSKDRNIKTLGIYTDYTKVDSGLITCISSHLTQFAVMYAPFAIVVDQPTGDPFDSSDSIPLLQQTPLLLYLMPALLAVVILLLAVVGLIMNQLEYNRPPRFYNKLTLTDNIQKYSLLRITGCMILQFNPLFNYIFKTNLYLGRPLRLLIFINYLNLFSVGSLIYYSSLGERLRIADIFWFGISLEILITILRPRVQEVIFGLFYPVQLASWKSKDQYRMRKQRQLSPKKTKKNKGLYTDEEEDNELGEAHLKQNKIPIDYEPSKKRPQSSKVHKEAGLDQSDRFDNSGKRLIINPEMKNKNIDDTTDIILQQQNQQIESPDTSKGDEVKILRDKKKKKKEKATSVQRKAKQNVKNKKTAEQKKQLSVKGSKYNNNQKWLEHQNAPQEDQTDITQQKLQKSDTSSSENSQPNDFDNNKAIDIDLTKFQKNVNSRAQYLPDINQQQQSPVRIIDRNSNELLRDSSEFNPLQSNQQKGNKDYAGFEFESVEVSAHDNTRNHPIHIDLHSRELSALDIDDSRDDLQKQFYAAPEEEEAAFEYGEEYYFEDAELQDDQNQQKEGGEQEPQSQGKFDCEEFKEITGASPTPLQGFSRIDHQDNNVQIQQPNLRSNQQNNENYGFDDSSQKRNQGAHQVQDGQQIQQSYPEESTPSLESVYKNYRELKLQPTDPLKKIIGILLLLVQFVVSIVVHGVLLIDLTKNQFLNWISCTIFSFTVMIFLTDSIMYSVVAWALKRTNGITDRRKCCSLFNIFIYWPLGKWKFMELEIELSKLKDFDKEYEVSRQA